MVGCQQVVSVIFAIAALGLFCPSSVDAKKRGNEKVVSKLNAPKLIVLGKDKSASIRVVNPGALVEFYANVGRIVSTKVGKTSVEALYEPPADRFPQVAIIVAASSDRSVLEWIAVPMHGQPKINIQSIRRADVVAHVGEESFGPVRTNSRGHALLQLVVPPGLQEVTLTTTDRLGSVSRSSTALNAPAFSRVLALCPSGDADDVLFFATDSSAAPLPTAQLMIKSNVALGKTRKIRDGVYAAQIPVAGATESQAFEVTASLQGSPQFSSSCAGQRPGTWPAAMRLRLSSDSYTAGAGNPVEVVVQLDYADERRRRKPVLALEPSFGSLSSLARRSDTEFVAEWNIPDGFEGLQSASVSVSFAGQSELDSETKIELKAGAASSLKLRARQESLPADGSSTTEVVATLKDAYGNAVVGTTLDGQTSTSLSSFASSKEPGRYAATYTAPRSFETQSELLSVREALSGVVGTLVVGLVPIKKRFVADLRFGYTTNLGLIEAPSGTLAAAYRFALGAHYALIGAHAGLYRSSSSEVTDSGSSLDLSVVGAPLLATVAYERLLRRFSIFVGAGAGIVYSRTKLSSMSTGSRTVTQYSPGGGAFVGSRLPLGPGHLVAQASYWTAPIDRDGVSGNLLGLVVDLGYGFDL